MTWFNQMIGGKQASLRDSQGVLGLLHATSHPYHTGSAKWGRDDACTTFSNLRFL